MEIFEYALKFEKLEINNFRGFENIVVNFDEHLTVFIGVNGSGKTSILDLLSEFLRQTTFAWLKNHPALNELNLATKRDVNVVKEISENLCSFSIKYPFYDEKGNWRSVSQTNIQANIILDKSRLEPNFDFKNSNILNEMNLGYEHIRRANPKRFSLPLFAYYRNNLNFASGTEGFDDYILSIYDDILFFKEVKFANIKKWFEWMQKLAYQRSENAKSRIVNIAYDNILSMLNDDDDKEKFNQIYIDWENTRDGEFVIVKNGINLKENQLSSGEKLLFTLVADISYKLAIANPSSLNPSKEGTGVVLIDEIDLHLHPKWQRKVVTKLRAIFPNVQFVITTHSPVILTELYSKHIRVLDNGQIFGIRDSFGHSEEEMLEEMGGNSERKKQIKEIQRLLAQNKISEAKEKRAKIEVEGEFAPLLEIDLFIQRKEKAML